MDDKLHNDQYVFTMCITLMLVDSIIELGIRVA